jgi:serine O-acetyltransferase
VPAGCTAVGVPSRNLCQCNTATAPLDHGQLPDVDAAVIRQLLDRIDALEVQMQSLNAHSIRSATPTRSF